MAEIGAFERRKLEKLLVPAVGVHWRLALCCSVSQLLAGSCLCR